MGQDKLLQIHFNRSTQQTFHVEERDKMGKDTTGNYKDDESFCGGCSSGALARISFACRRLHAGNILLLAVEPIWHNLVANSLDAFK